MKSKGPWSRKAIRFLLTACFVPALSGCRALNDWPLTYKLWDDRMLARFNEPAGNPHLQLFQSARTNDVLVQYDEAREKNEKVRRRSFFLNANLARLEGGKKPRFVSPRKADNWRVEKNLASSARARRTTCSRFHWFPSFPPSTTPTA